MPEMNALAGFQPNSSRDLIVRILSSEFPLSAKKIHNKLKREHALNVSYQAVHKTLKQLLEEGVLEKHESDYRLCKEWIEKIKIAGTELKETYSQESIIKELDENGSASIDCSSISELDFFLINSMSKFVSLAGRKRLFMYWNHFWAPLFHSKEEYSGLKMMASLESFFVSQGNSVIDQWCAKFWSKAGVKVKVGVKSLEFPDCVVFGDYVIQVFFPKPILNWLDSLFSKTQKITDLDVDEFFHSTFEKKTRIPVVVHKNKELADRFRKEILAFFE